MALDVKLLTFQVQGCKTDVENLKVTCITTVFLGFYTVPEALAYGCVKQQLQERNTTCLFEL